MIQRWLDVEAALARAEARLGIVPAAAADEITRKARVEQLDLGEMKRELEAARHPIMPLIHCLARVCEPEAAEFIHQRDHQDILDTGSFSSWIGSRHRDARSGRFAACSRPWRAAQDTVQAGRTHGQQALIASAKLAVWVAELDRYLERSLSCAQAPPARGRGGNPALIGGASSPTLFCADLARRPGDRLAHRPGRRGGGRLRLRAGG
jgi:adenylosuccinate lyase